MKITAVRGWYPVDEERSFAIGSCYEADLPQALEAEHSCENSACDICHAREAGFPSVAADLLRSATETPLLAAVERAHHLNGTAVNGRGEDQWEAWLEHWSQAKQEGRLWQCPQCEGFDWGSDECGNCWAPRPLWRLLHVAYCGITRDLSAHVDAGTVRWDAAFEIHRARSRGFEVVTLEKGSRWEILEPEGSLLVPDECGVLSLELSS